MTDSINRESLVINQSSEMFFGSTLSTAVTYDAWNSKHASVLFFRQCSAEFLLFVWSAQLHVESMSSSVSWVQQMLYMQFTAIVFCCL